MATREERLVGHQLIKRTNQANFMLHDASLLLQDMDPTTLEELYEPPGDSTVPVRADVDHIKLRVNNCCTVADRQSLMVNEFISRFTDQSLIIAGITHFSALKTEVDTDIGLIRVHVPNTVTAVALSTDKPTLASHGQTLALYEPQLDRVVAPHELTLSENRISSVQDLMNAAAFELQGINSSTGAALGSTEEEIRELALVRIQTIERLLPTTPNTGEVSAWVVVKDYIKAELQTPKTFTELETLGQYIDAQVPQIPLVRRWWAY